MDPTDTLAVTPVATAGVLWVQAVGGAVALTADARHTFSPARSTDVGHVVYRENR